MISPSLKQKVAICIFSGVIMKNKRFKRFVEEKMNKYNDYLSIRPNKELKLELEQKIINVIVRKMATQLNQPEDIVIQQFDDTTDMYFIAKGECSVILIDEKKKAHEKSLRIGDYFGEISMIYGCKR